MDEFAEIEARFERARRTYRWSEEESVIEEARRYDATHPEQPVSLAERLRARQQFAPVDVPLEVAA